MFFDGAWLLSRSRNLCYMFQSCNDNRVCILMHGFLTIYVYRFLLVSVQIGALCLLLLYGGCGI